MNGFRLWLCRFAVFAMITAVCLSAQEAPKKTSDEKLLKRIPTGYVFSDEVRGDLNGDGAEDYVILINAKTNDDYLGLMILFKDGDDDYKLALEIRRCFYTEFRGPSFKINRGNLIISFNGDGTCDRHDWSYTFKYRNSEFELIGYDANDIECGGWNEDHVREGGGAFKESINFLTKKRLTKVNKDKDVWSKITTKGPILLQQLIKNLDFGLDDNDLKYAEESGTIADARDGKVYWTTKIGQQTWTAENLNYTPKTGKSWCYNDSSSYCGKYGRLYDWEAAKTVCPAGYRLPTDAEWVALVTFAGGWSAGGVKLKKESGWNAFQDRNGNGTDKYGFSALPGGSRSIDGKYSTAGYFGYWWTATEYTIGNAYNIAMGYRDDEDAASHGYGEVRVGFSVRCVTD